MLEYSSTLLAHRFNKILRGPEHEIVSLSGVPAYIPVSFGDRFREFLDMVPGYRAVYGSKDSAGLIEETDTIFTGVGVLANHDPHPGVFLTERCNREPISEEELAKLVYGDIGGVLIEQPGTTSADSQFVAKMNRQWTGLQREHLERCARQASGGRGSGVVVFAQGSCKAPLLLKGIALGLINVLVIDETLETAMKESLEQDVATMGVR